jgi:hypothetical protein
MVTGVLDVLTVLMFELRSQYALSQLATQEHYGSIAYEYEKNSYPLAMADLLWDDPASALIFLQQLDSQADASLGIDLHSGFTLKGQIRKYFRFGDRLDPTYRQRMWEAMRQFTETDPLNRQANPPRKFWERSRDDCETPVDCRNTDNLRAMRDTSVYLMAEETGNEATRLIYQQHLERYVSTLLDIGMGEWDSPVYHGHTTTAYLNLYDFAQDPAVKKLAKDALDWLFTAAALKYWRGDWNGPAKRVYGEGAAAFFWLYFGDALPPTELERDWIYGITSSYRPPAVAIAIAQRQFHRPMELLRSHPHYENWKPELYGPAFYETLYFGQTFQLGSLANGSAGDWSGFSLRVQSGLGTDELTLSSDSPQTIAQYENLLIWQGQAPPQWVLPDCTVDQESSSLILLACEQTWIALYPLPQGIALEVAELGVEGTFSDFKQAVLKRTKLTIRPNHITYRSTKGKTLRLELRNNQLPHIWRDGTLHDWQLHTPGNSVNLPLNLP